MLKRTVSLLFMFFLISTVNIIHVYAQAPVVTPKKQPIVLRLDSQGKHIVVIDSLATVTNSTDSVIKYKFKPASFDCSTIGKRLVDVVASTNGYVNTITPTSVGFNNVLGVTFDPAGNYYIVENASFIIRKVSPNGEVSVLAGSGIDAFSNGKGAAASMGNILDAGIIADSLGNIYFSDAQYNRIRKITPDGTVSTFAGNGRAGLYDGKADIAEFNSPGGLAFDNKNNLYVVDFTNNAIRKITPDGTVSTIAGAGKGTIDAAGTPAFFGDLHSIAVDGGGNIFVGEQRSLRETPVIKKITPAGFTSIFYNPGKLGYANNADEANAFYVGPLSLRFDPAGDLYYGDYGILKKISPVGKVTFVAGKQGEAGSVDGSRTNARFGSIDALASDPCGNLIVCDNNVGIRKVSTNGDVTTIAGGGYKVTGNVGASSCQITMATIPVQVQSTPKFLNNFPDITLNDCANLADYTIKALVTDNCPANKITIKQSPTPNSPIFNNVPVKVTLTATDTTGGSASVSFTVTVKYSAQPPGRSVTVSASKTAICIGEAVTFTANTINADAGTTYQWLLNGDKAGTGSPIFTTSNLANGDVVNCAVTTGSGCGIPNLGLPVAVSVDSIPVIKLKTKEDIIGGKSVLLNSKVTGKIATYKWTPTVGLSDPNIQLPIATPATTTTYTLTVTTSAGCTTQSSETIYVINNIIIPNTFTPNGDGINDFWAINHLSDYTNATVTIYSRNGLIVYESKGYSIPWNGTRNGGNLPVGAYYYIIDLKDGSKPRSGAVTLIR